jgi:hypothetical protein
LQILYIEVLLNIHERDADCGKRLWRGKDFLMEGIVIMLDRLVKYLRLY